MVEEREATKSEQTHAKGKELAFEEQSSEEEEDNEVEELEESEEDEVEKEGNEEELRHDDEQPLSPHENVVEDLP